MASVTESIESEEAIPEVVVQSSNKRATRVPLIIDEGKKKTKIPWVDFLQAIQLWLLNHLFLLNMLVY
jgi:hypothetical protein